MTTNIPEGYELLSGRSRENAKAALALAEERGIDTSAVLTTPGGYLIPLADDDGSDVPASDDGSDVPDATAGEIIFPDAEKANHSDIDAFATEHEVSYEGIEAKDADKPTKAEKIAHIKKVVGEHAEANSKAPENGQPAGGLEPAGD